MRVILTGSSGFVGSYLLKRLYELNYEVIEIDIRNGFDILNWEEIKRIPKFDICLHLAARSFVPDSYKESRSFYNLNTIGTLNMLELCKIHNAKIIFTSSYVYGVPQYLPIDENHPIIDFNPYAHTKIIGEQLCYSYSKYFNVPFIIFRPFNIYGFGQSDSFLIPEIIKKAMSGNKIELLDPNPKRDMIYIDDLIEAFISALKFNCINEIFNIGYGQSFSVDEVAKIIIKNISSDIELDYKNKQRINEVNNVIANIQKAEKLLAWKPTTSLEEGIAKTLYNYSSNNE